MNIHLRRIAIGPCVKVATILYGLMGIIMIPFFLLAALMDPDMKGFGMAFALFLPIIYAVIGAIAGLIGSAIYNGIAGMVGGFEFELEELPGRSGLAASYDAPGASHP
jgi:hypothetical protein